MNPKFEVRQIFSKRYCMFVGIKAEKMEISRENQNMTSDS